MNIHLIAILLAFKSPIPVDSLPLLTQEQISAPLTLGEDKALLWSIHAMGMGQ